jgi:uncharacterized membrane protein
MKTGLIIISVALLAALWVFNYSVNAQNKNDVLKNSNQRAEIFKSIAGNKTYMKEFLNTINNNKSGLELMANDLMSVSKKNNDIGTSIGNMMMNDPQYVNLMMTQMINRANSDDAFGKSMLNMMKNHSHLYGMMQNMMNGNNMGNNRTGNNHMGNNHMGNNTHKGNSSRGGMMNHGHGMGNGIGSSSAHSAHPIKR